MLADTPGIAVVATFAVVITFLLRRARLAVMLIVALVTELTVFLTVNYAVERPRPHVAHVASTPSTYSWPSGHVAATLTLYGGIALIVAADDRPAHSEGRGVAGRRVPCRLRGRVPRV